MSDKTNFVPNILSEVEIKKMVFSAFALGAKIIKDSGTKYLNMEDKDFYLSDTPKIVSTNELYNMSDQLSEQDKSFISLLVDDIKSIDMACYISKPNLIIYNTNALKNIILDMRSDGKSERDIEQAITTIATHELLHKQVQIESSTTKNGIISTIPNNENLNFQAREFIDDTNDGIIHVLSSAMVKSHYSNSNLISSLERTFSKWSGREGFKDSELSIAFSLLTTYSTDFASNFLKMKNNPELQKKIAQIITKLPKNISKANLYLRDNFDNIQTENNISNVDLEKRKKNMSLPNLPELE